MAKNLIPEIARMLGVEIGEEFKIKGWNELTYKFDNDGLRVSCGNGARKFNPTANTSFTALLAGEDEIVKLPWKPKKGDVYFSFGRLGDKWVVRSLWWGGFPEEYALLDKGWVYRSEEEAQAALHKVAAELGVEYEL